MARFPLDDVAFADRFAGVAAGIGSFTVTDGGGTAAKVYQDATTATLLTSPYSFGYARTIVGYVEPGPYTFTSNGFDWTTQLGDTRGVFNHLRDHTLGYSTLPGGYADCNSDAVTLTSGTVIFTRLEPVRQSFTFNNIVLVSGATESATETDQRVGLHTSDGTTMTRVALSAASVALLETDDTRVESPLASAATYTVVPGVSYWVSILSVATTAGTVCGKVTTTSVGAASPAAIAADMPVPTYTLASQTALDATEAISGMTAAFIQIPWLHLTFVVV